MTAQKHYRFHPVHRGLEGFAVCELSQLAHPEHHTTAVPLDAPDGQINVLSASGEWGLQTDYRFTLWHDPATGEQRTLTAAGETPPAGWVAGEYSPSQAELDAIEASARNAAIIAACQRLTADRDRRDMLPVTVAGVLVDAHAEARENINGVRLRLLEGRGLPSGWIGWRVFDNSMVHAASDAATVLAWLQDVANAIEQRRQGLMIACWQHKAAVAALTDIGEISAYPSQAAWPA